MIALSIPASARNLFSILSLFVYAARDSVLTDREKEKTITIRITNSHNVTINAIPLCEPYLSPLIISPGGDMIFYTSGATDVDTGNAFEPKDLIGMIIEYFFPSKVILIFVFSGMYRSSTHSSSHCPVPS